MRTLRHQYTDIAEHRYISMMVSGPPGVGKTFEAERCLDLPGKTTLVKPNADANSLADKLYDYSRKGTMILFDDMDHLLKSHSSINILKLAMDPKRWLGFPLQRFGLDKWLSHRLIGTSRRGRGLVQGGRSPTGAGPRPRWRCHAAIGAGRWSR